MAARANARQATRKTRQQRTSDQKPPAPGSIFALTEIAGDIEAAMNGLELETWAATQVPAQGRHERESSARHVSLLNRVIYDRVARLRAIATSLRPVGAATDGVGAPRPSGGA